MNHPHDDLSILVTLKADGNIEKTVVGSVVESLILDSGNTVQFNRLKEIFSSGSLQMATFTITEKGYSLTDGRGLPLADVTIDMQNGPGNPDSYIGKIASLLHTRYITGGIPIAMVSMDNCSHNGDKLRSAVTAFAKAWEENGDSRKRLPFLCGRSFQSVISMDYDRQDYSPPRSLCGRAAEKRWSGKS